MDANSLFGDHPRHYVVTHRFDPKQLELIMTGLTDLQAAVDANTAGVGAAVTALQALSSAGDPDSQVGALAATIVTNNATLAAAVAAATPAVTPPAA